MITCSRDRWGRIQGGLRPGPGSLPGRRRAGGAPSWTGDLEDEIWSDMDATVAGICVVSSETNKLKVTLMSIHLPITMCFKLTWLCFSSVCSVYHINSSSACLMVVFTIEIRRVSIQNTEYGGVVRCHRDCPRENPTQTLRIWSPHSALTCCCVCKQWQPPAPSGWSV